MIDTVSNMLMDQFVQTSGCLNSRKYQEVFLWWIKLTFELKFNILNTFPISWCQWATMTMTFFFISLYFFAFYILYFKTIWRSVPSSYGCHLFNDFFVLFLEEYAIPQYSYMAFLMCEILVVILETARMGRCIVSLVAFVKIDSRVICLCGSMCFLCFIGLFYLGLDNLCESRYS